MPDLGLCVIWWTGMHGRLLVGTGGTEDAARMRLLRQCCDLYQGNHPFHNYTKRRLYRPSEKRLPAGAVHALP